MKVANVVCIKWGDRYPAYYVNRLYLGVKRFLLRPHRFHCFTDVADGIAPEVEVHPLPVEPFDDEIVRLMNVAGRRGAWRKISLFKPGLANMDGAVLGFDLDVAITGPLDDLFDHQPGKVCMRRDWLEQRRLRPGGHGSVFRFEASRHRYLYDEFAADPAGCAARAKGSEQKYTSLTAIEHGDLAYFPPHWIASFKRNAIPMVPLNFLLEPRLPAGTRVMCFHGKPKMEQAMEGYQDEWRYATRAARWLRDYWLQEPIEPLMPPAGSRKGS